MKKILFIILSLFALNGMAQEAGNVTGTLLPSLARTATANSATLNNSSWKGVKVIINMSAFTSGTFTAHIQGQNPITSAYYDVCVSPAIVATGVTVLTVYPGLTNSSNVICSDILPAIWRLSVVGASTPVGTYSASMSLNY